jgi:uncharacterized protein (DUF983 family)
MSGPGAGGAPAPVAVAVALKGLCPRCGAETLFAGMLAFSPKCAACDLDLASFNVGDGAAALVTLVVGALVVIGAVTMQLALAPPFWVQGLIWVPLTAAAVIYALRVAKAALLALEYRNAAREGRLRQP